MLITTFVIYISISVLPLSTYANQVIDPNKKEEEPELPQPH